MLKGPLHKWLDVCFPHPAWFCCWGEHDVSIAPATSVRRIFFLKHFVLMKCDKHSEPVPEPAELLIEDKIWDFWKDQGRKGKLK